MSESILSTTKKVLGIAEGFDAFDQDVIMHINATFATLDQLGVGPDGGVFITDGVTKWSALHLPPNQLALTRTYVYLKVRQAFDPPTTSFAIESVKSQIEQIEWRLCVMADPPLPAEDPNGAYSP